MKKIFFFVAVMFAAIAMNAKEITIDLSKYSIVKSETATANAAVNSGVLKVNYVATLEWDDIAGVSFAIDKQKVTSMSFEYQGDAAATDWVSFFGYLEEEDGTRWYSAAADMSLSTPEWQNSMANYFPTDGLWCTPSHKAGEKPFVAVGFIANPSKPTTASFSIKNVKITVEGGTGIDNTAVDAQATKLIRDGQLVIIRNGVEYNAAGQMK